MTDKAFDNLLQLLISENKDDQNLGLGIAKLRKSWSVENRKIIYLLKAWMQCRSGDDNKFFGYIYHETQLEEFLDLFDEINTKEEEALNRCAKKILLHK